MARHTETPPQPLVFAVTEHTFARHVLRAPCPVVVLFGTPGCPASRALRSLLPELVSEHAGQIRVATVNAERDPLLMEQVGALVAPTMMIVQDGEIVTRVVGFLPPALLRLLCAQVAAGTLPPEPFWSPSEATFEDLVVVPLLEAWGFTYVRQAACPAPARGRIDFLIYDDPLAQPLTLFENKRNMLSTQALNLAAAQAHRYARSLHLRSFVVATPAGLWIYACMGTRPLAVRSITSLALLKESSSVPQLLRHLSRPMTNED